jgi:pimeloyl-[acyl-carrier protein] synthase
MDEASEREIQKAMDALIERSPAVLADPYPYYAIVRDRAGVYCRGEPRPGYVFTRAAEVRSALKDARFSSRRDHGGVASHQIARLPEPLRSQGFALLRFNEAMLLQQDGEAHRRLRKWMMGVLTSTPLEALGARVEPVANGLLREAWSRGRFDVVADYARPLPALVMLDLLGVPAAHHPQLLAWTDDIALFSDGMRGVVDAHRAMVEFIAFGRELLTARRRDPQRDLLTSLVRSASEDEGAVSEDELLANVILLLLAGTKSSANLIGTATLALLRHPDQLERLRAEPALIASAVEEFLRYDSPAQVASRICTEPCDYGGLRIPAGAKVILWIGAANRDPLEFEQPEQLDIARPNNRHLSFASGLHGCAGAGVARREAQIAIGALVTRFPQLRLASAPVWNPNLTLRGLASLPVTHSDAR